MFGSLLGLLEMGLEATDALWEGLSMDLMSETPGFS